MAIGKTIPVGSLNYGYPGTYSRNSGLETSARKVAAAGANGAAATGPAFGDVVVPVSASVYDVISVKDFIADGGTFTAAMVLGIVVREVRIGNPATAPYSQQNGIAVVAPNNIADVAKRGFLSVKVNNGTPAPNGTVHVRVANGTASKPIGGIEAVADGANTVALTNIKFTNGKIDANGVSEVQILNPINS